MGFFDFFDEKSKEEKDLEDAYGEGVEEGRDAGFFEQIAHEFVDMAAGMLPDSDAHEWKKRQSWDAGYHEGAAQGRPGDEDEDDSEDAEGDDVEMVVEYYGEDDEDYDDDYDDDLDDYDEDNDEDEEDEEADKEQAEPAPPPPPAVKNVKPARKKTRRSRKSVKVSPPKSGVCPHCKKVRCDVRIEFHE